MRIITSSRPGAPACATVAGGVLAIIFLLSGAGCGEQRQKAQGASESSVGQLSPRQRAEARSVADVFVGSLLKGKSERAAQLLAEQSAPLAGQMKGIAEQMKHDHYVLARRLPGPNESSLYEFLGNFTNPGGSREVLYAKWRVDVAREAAGWGISGYEQLIWADGPPKGMMRFCGRVKRLSYCASKVRSRR